MWMISKWQKLKIFQNVFFACIKALWLILRTNLTPKQDPTIVGRKMGGM